MQTSTRSLHAASVAGAMALAGAVIFFVLGSLGLRGVLPDAALPWVMGALPVLLLACTVWAIRRQLPYRASLPVAGVSAALLGYLAYDEPSRTPAPDLGRVAAADSRSFAAYRWMVRNDPDGRRAGQPKRATLPPAATGQQSEWLALADKHRVEIEAAWVADDLGRAWIEAMAEAAPDGIYPPMVRPDDTLDFAAVRHIAQTRWGYAQVLMHDRRDDEAARTLLPMVRAYYHLQQGSTMLVSQMIAVVVLKGTYQRLEMLADAGRLSPVMRTDVAGALREAPPLPTALRNAFLGEQMFARSYIEETTRDAAKAVKAIASQERTRLPAIPVLSRLFYNPHRSEREYAEFLDEVRQLAEQRRLDELERKSGDLRHRLAQRPLKNPVGQMFMEMSLPAFSKTVAAAWQMEDQRVALLTRLERG